MVNIFGVRKPSFRIFQMLAEAGSTRAALSLVGADANVYSVALLDGADLHSSSTLTIIVANHACTHRCATPEPLNVTLDLRGLSAAPKSATVARINASSANPKAKWEELGAPDYPSPSEIASIHAASAVLESPAAVVEHESGVWVVTDVLLEPYSVLAVKLRLKADDEAAATMIEVGAPLASRPWLGVGYDVLGNTRTFPRSRLRTLLR